MGAHECGHLDELPAAAAVANHANEKALTAERAATVATISDWDVKCAFLRTLLLQREHFEEGLPPYRSLDGCEVPAFESSLLSPESLNRFLHGSGGDVNAAAYEIEESLKWRRRVFPSDAAVLAESRALSLMREGRRFRSLGPNLDGDLVFVLDSCWGLFLDDASVLDVLRMTVLAVETALAEADALGHPQILLICFGGPPPSIFAKSVVKSLERNYPERLKGAVMYPVPTVLVPLAQVALFFLSADTRKKICVTGDDNVLMEFARLTPDQLPVTMRGGVAAVTEHFKPDTNLLNGIALEYLSPFQESCDQLLSALEGPWESASAETSGDDASGLPGWFGF